MIIRLFFITIFYSIFFLNNSFAANIEQEMNKAVERLNELYNSHTSACVVYLNLESPASDCSGIFIHGMEPGQTHIWIPDQSDPRKAVSFSYLRSDIPTNQLFSPNGFIYDQTSQDPKKKKLKLYCFYPFDAFSDNSETHPYTSHGCGLTNTPFPSQLSGDYESCSSASVTTADQWIQKYLPEQKPSFIVDDSCSFSPNQINSFLEVLKIQQETQSPYWNELITEMWSFSEAEHLPILAFFYQKGNEDGRVEAFFQQQDYCQNYKKFVPVVALDLNAGSSNAFSGNLSEQSACK
ncbi:hypothetical protein [Paenochrobactrum glaciei]|uniref:Halovibrin HvnB n=1 Tax=Paenochrobactrum glaciei TaxID=486407 RepID=A0ABN1FVK0_9HYPH